MRPRLAAATLPALLGFCFLILPPLQSVVHLSYDLPFYLRPDTAVDELVILYMDEESEARLGQGRWDRWDRAQHARLLEKLTAGGAKAVVFDVLFWPQGTNDAANHQLARAARAHGRVVVAARNAFRFHDGDLIGSELSKPYDELAEAATWGMVEAGDSNRAVREHYRDLVYEHPSLAWRAAELTMSPPLPDPLQRRWVNYYGPAGHLPHLRYSDVFETNLNLTSAFSNKVVFVGGLWSIGFTGGKGTDDFRTPHTLWTGRKAAGVEINATTYLNFVHRDWLRRLPPLAEATWVFLVGALVGLGLGYLRPVTAVASGFLGALVLTAIAVALMWSTKVWFPWSIVVVAQIPFAVGWAILMQTRELERDKKVLEQALVMVQGGTPPAVVGPRTPAPQVAPAAAVDVTRPVVPDHELIRCIGKGGYGQVWLARDIIGTYHAVKIVFRKEFQDDEPFEREFRGLRRFTPISRTHPGFVHVLHVGRNESEQYIYYVMELGDDKLAEQRIHPETYAPKTLATELRRLKRLPLVECLEISIHLADALQHLHQHHLIHRDIKPANIIFVKGMAKFADIGLVTEAATTARAVTYVGTKGYIAPEGPGTAAGDVYGLGKVIYEAAFGLDVSRYPELSTTIVAQPETSALFAMNHIVLKACEADAAKRYQSAADLRLALVHLRAGLGLEARE